MFTKKSRTRKAGEQIADAGSGVSDTVVDTWGRVAPVVGAGAKVVGAKAGAKAALAGAKAKDAASWAAPRVQSGYGVAQPKVGAAVHAAVDAMSPAVDAARDKVSPAVDAARDKVSPAVDVARERIDELMPRVIEALHAAAAAGAAAGVAAGEYKSRSGDAVAVLRGEATVKPTKRKRGRRLLFLVILPAAIAAGYAAYSARQPKDDPWAVPTGTYPSYTPPTPATSTPTASDVDDLGTLSSGSAADALDSTAQVPGLTVESEPTDTIDLDASTSPESSDPTAPNDQH